MTRQNQKRRAPSVATKSRKRSGQTAPLRTSARKAACVLKESSKNKSLDCTDDFSSINDESSVRSNHSDNGNNSSNVEDKDRESLPPKSVNVNATTVSSVTNAPQVAHQNYDYNRQPSYYGSVVVDERTDQQIREDLRNYLRRYWYQEIKFIINDEQSRDLIEDSIRTKEVVKPNEWSYEQFYDKYQDRMKTALSAIRHNGQCLARKNYLRKNAKKTLS